MNNEQKALFDMSMALVRYRANQIDKDKLVELLIYQIDEYVRKENTR